MGPYIIIRSLQEEGEGDLTQEREDDMKMEAEMGPIRLQLKEHQELPAITGSEVRVAREGFKTSRRPKPCTHSVERIHFCC